MAADGSWRQLLNGFVMEVNTLSIIIYVLVPILTAVLGGWVGAYFGNKYREDKESHEKEIVRNIAGAKGAGERPDVFWQERGIDKGKD